MGKKEKKFIGRGEDFQPIGELWEEMEELYPEKDGN